MEVFPGEIEADIPVLRGGGLMEILHRKTVFWGVTDNTFKFFIAF